MLSIGAMITIVVLVTFAILAYTITTYLVKKLNAHPEGEQVAAKYVSRALGTYREE